MSIKAVVFIPFLAFGVRSFNFCDFNSRHILCNATEVPTNVNKGFSVYPKNDFERNRILLSFNAIRRKVASGTFVRGNTQLPKAANLMRLEWCRECEKAAWNVIKDCAFDHSKLNCCDCTNTGQMYLSFLTVISPIGRKSRKFEVGNVLRDIVQYDEDFDLRCLYNVTRRDCFERESKFIMVSSDRVTHVGCAYKDCTNINYQDIFICFFGFNLTAALHRPLYVVGEPCSSCRMNSRCKEQSDFLCECDTNKTCHETPFPLGESCPLSDNKYPEYRENIMRKEDYGIYEKTDAVADVKMPPVKGRFIGTLIALLLTGISTALTSINTFAPELLSPKAPSTAEAAAVLSETVEEAKTVIEEKKESVGDIKEFIGKALNKSDSAVHDNLTHVVQTIDMILQNDTAANNTDEIVLRILNLILNKTKESENSTDYYKYDVTKESKNNSEDYEYNATKGFKNSSGDYEYNVTQFTTELPEQEIETGEGIVEMKEKSDYEEFQNNYFLLKENPVKKTPNIRQKLRKGKTESEKNFQDVTSRSKNISLFLCFTFLLII